MNKQTVRAQLAGAGLKVGVIHRNLPAPELTARALARKEGILAANGALVVTAGQRTGRSPADRYIVDEPAADGVAWGGANQACSPAYFERQLRRASEYLSRRDVYVFDGFLGAEPAYCIPIRVVPALSGTRSSRTPFSCPPSRSTSRASAPASRSSTSEPCLRSRRTKREGQTAAQPPGPLATRPALPSLSASPSSAA